MPQLGEGVICGGTKPDGCSQKKSIINQIVQKRNRERKKEAKGLSFYGRKKITLENESRFTGNKKE